jgi:hypothetical protein
MTKADIVQHFGGVTAAAKALKTNRQTVQRWRDKVPLGRQYEIQILTGGKLRANSQGRAA